MGIARLACIAQSFWLCPGIITLLGTQPWLRVPIPCVHGHWSLLNGQCWWPRWHSPWLHLFYRSLLTGNREVPLSHNLLQVPSWGSQNSKQADPLTWDPNWQWSGYHIGWFRVWSVGSRTPMRMRLATPPAPIVIISKQVIQCLVPFCRVLVFRVQMALVNLVVQLLKVPCSDPHLSCCFSHSL